MAYASLDKVFKLLGVTPTPSNLTNHPSLEFIMSRVDNAINEHCNREFIRADRTETVPLYSQLIALTLLPVNSITSVSINGASVSLDNVQLFEYGFNIFNMGIYDYRDSALVTVTYNGGYDTIPDAISYAAALQSVHEYQRSTHIGASRVTNDGGSVNYPELGLLKEVKNMINNYKHPIKKLRF